MRSLKITWLWIFTAILLFNCQGEEGLPGPAGPPGPQGPQGPQGAPLIGLTYDVIFDLNSENNWLAFYSFPAEDEIYPTDVVLVYLYKGEAETEDGGTVEVWRLMPINYFDERGLRQLNFDFSVVDVSLFVEAPFPLDAERDVFDEFLARIVVVPADYSPNARKSQTIDYANYEEVKKAFGLPDLVRKPARPFVDIMKGN